ncbi:hypothetical protein NMY22_g19013 [Coprinellus aureogranulatus]|nr:hypothetical protein NMY22_g19013 [Coprinellus aureogranulatus]
MPPASQFDAASMPTSESVIILPSLPKHWRTRPESVTFAANLALGVHQGVKALLPRLSRRSRKTIVGAELAPSAASLAFNQVRIHSDTKNSAPTSRDQAQEASAAIQLNTPHRFQSARRPKYKR